jgi:hypothetical protein
MNANVSRVNVFFFFFSAVSSRACVFSKARTFGGKMWLKKGEKRGKKNRFCGRQGTTPRAGKTREADALSY